VSETALVLLLAHSVKTSAWVGALLYRLLYYLLPLAVDVMNE